MFVDQGPLIRKQHEANRAVNINYSTSGQPSDIEFMKSCIADTFLLVLESEESFETSFREGLKRRRREAGIRPICDGCATTIFSGHFVCCCCGKELCLACYSEWDDLEDSGFENVDGCRGGRRHTKLQFGPYTYFKEDELEKLIKEVKACPRKMALGTHSRRYPMETADGFLPYAKPHIDDITEEEFQLWWGLRQPLVLTGCLQRFSLPWTPEYFVEHYGSDECHLFDCRTDQVITSTVGEFFQEFNSTESQKPLKLKVHHSIPELI
jgi:hypothetical protein